MIKSYYFFVAGILALLWSVGHAVTGHVSVLAELRPGLVRHAVFVYLHQTTWLMLASSVILLGGSFMADPGRINAVAAFAATVFAGNFIFFLVTSLAQQPDALSNLVPQVLFVVTYVGLIVVGIVKAGSHHAPPVDG